MDEREMAGAENGRVRAGPAANSELVALYSEIGKLIVGRQKAERWGSAVIEREVETALLKHLKEFLIDLKTRLFAAEDAGKMNFYLNDVGRIVREMRATYMAQTPLEKQQ